MIRVASRMLAVMSAALLFSPLACPQGKTPAAKGNAGGSPLQVQVGVYPGASLRTLPQEAARALPVVIFSSATFNAANVNPATLTLAAPKSALAGANGKSACHMEDVNQDGQADIVCTMQTNSTQAKPGLSQVTLEGLTFDGASFRGQFSLQLIPGAPSRPAPPKH